MHPDRTRRLPHVSYVGPCRYFLTLCTHNRKRHFDRDDIVDCVRMELIDMCEQHEFALPAYCFMPDHLHLLAEGLGARSDLKRFVARFKQRAGYVVGQRHGERLWQPGYYDHILRSDEVTARVALYILENPVRAGLVRSYTEYRHSGSTICSVEQVAETAARWQG
jgi:putative transposase